MKMMRMMRMMGDDFGVLNDHTNLEETDYCHIKIKVEHILCKTKPLATI